MNKQDIANKLFEAVSDIENKPSKKLDPRLKAKLEDLAYAYIVSYPNARNCLLKYNDGATVEIMDLLKDAANKKLKEFAKLAQVSPGAFFLPDGSIETHTNALIIDKWYTPSKK